MDLNPRMSPAGQAVLGDYGFAVGALPETD